MSAYIVPVDQIIVLVKSMFHAPFHHGPLSALVPMARTLACENAASVNFRYSESEPDALAHLTDDEVEKLLERCPLRPALALLKAADNYAYQSCEHDGWAASNARLHIDAIIRTAHGRLPGYAEAPWQWAA